MDWESLRKVLEKGKGKGKRLRGAVDWKKLEVWISFRDGYGRRREESREGMEIPTLSRIVFFSLVFFKGK